MAVLTKSIVFSNKDTPNLVEEAIADLPDGGVLVETETSGVSQGTERMWLDGSASALRSERKSYPYTPGYALVGRVIEDTTGRWPIGTRVFATKPHKSHHILFESKGDTFFAVKEDTPTEDLLLVTLLGTALHSIERSHVSQNGSVAIVGSGLVGILIAKALTASVTDAIKFIVRPGSRATQMLAECGFETTSDPDEASSGVVFEATGSNEGLARAVKAVAPNGQIVATGFYNQPLEIDGEAFFAKEFDVASVKAGGPIKRLPGKNYSTRTENLEAALDLIQGRAVSAQGLELSMASYASYQNVYSRLSQRALPVYCGFSWKD